VSEAREEFLDLVEDRFGVFRKRKMVLTRKLDVLGAGNSFRQVSGMSHLDETVAGTRKDQRRRLDGRQDVSDVDLLEHVPDRDDRAYPGAQSLVPSPPLSEAGLVRHRRGDHVGEDPTSPSRTHLLDELLFIVRCRPQRIVRGPSEAGE
jgi:hypothetical protein